MSGSGSGHITPARRSAVPWLYGLSAMLVLISPLVFLGVWLADGTMTGLGLALLAAIADLVAAAVAAAVATTLAAQRGVRRVRSVVLGHPEGRAGRMAEHRAARWALARDRFSTLQNDYAAFESDPGAVARRPALVDVNVDTTAAFIEALGEAHRLETPHEPGGPRREEFVAAVDRAVDAWAEARHAADALAGAPSAPWPGVPQGPASTVGPQAAPGATPPRGLTPSRHPRFAPEPGEAEPATVTEAVRRAATREVRNLTDRLRA